MLVPDEPGRYDERVCQIQERVQHETCSTVGDVGDASRVLVRLCVAWAGCQKFGACTRSRAASEQLRLRIR